MPYRSVYLAKSLGGKNQRFHFAIFVPEESCNRQTLSKDFRKHQTTGTIIHVIGEPVMTGYALEIKRNHECSTSKDLRFLVHLGYIDEKNVYKPDDTDSKKEYTPRGLLEQYASRVPPPPRGQNIRDPIDGVKTKRCQEWTMEFLSALAKDGILRPEAIEIAQAERDPSTHGIFGLKR
ncbi:hypothetical protein FGRMN_3784 [Fusarium graminum]|nr:hypothetical protein FGRMN_3784 [Fusarium graminum]